MSIHVLGTVLTSEDVNLLALELYFEMYSNLFQYYLGYNPSTFC